MKYWLESESGLDQELLLVEAGAEELRALVEGGPVVLRVHNV